VKLLR
jgi:hypothetical protein